MKTVLLTVATDPANPTFKTGFAPPNKRGGQTRRFKCWEKRAVARVDLAMSKDCSGLQRLDPNDLVVFCDSYDLLLFGSPHDFEQVHRRCQCDILLGMDYACMERPVLDIIKPSCSGSLAPDRLLFVNGGGIMGWAKDLFKAYAYIAKHHQDDQIGWYDYEASPSPGTKSVSTNKTKWCSTLCLGTTNARTSSIRRC